ncbi:MAG: efflux transporter outer membrane subunit [Alphaproteobacteria bacterium]|nr:efflux transporter outer membrane subunit [Alphaproteobacteria bacterium]
MRFRTFLSIGVSSVALWGCESKRDHTPPSLPTLSDSLLQGVGAGTFEAREPVVAWWRELGDSELTQLVEKALEYNHDVRIAIANVEAARASLQGTRMDMFPTITTKGDITKYRISKNGVQGASPNSIQTAYQPQFDASWELDFFGRISESIHADVARFDSSQATLQDTYITVAGEVANAYIALRGAQLRLAIAHDNTKNQESIYKLVGDLASLGRSSQLDVANAKTLLEQVRAKIPSLEAAINTNINRLSVLTGKTPETLRQQLKKSKPLPSIPGMVAVGSLKDLLKRRPDVRAAEHNLTAAIADYNVSVTDLYPRVSLTGNLGFLSTSTSNLLSSQSLNIQAGPSISWGILDLGHVYARIDAADAKTKSALATFEKTVLGALEDLDTSMVVFARQREERDQLVIAASSSIQAADLADKRYRGGIDDYRTFLDAETTMFSAKDQLAVSEINTATNLIAIYKALGGGWQMAKAVPLDKCDDQKDVNEKDTPTT